MQVRLIDITPDIEEKIVFMARVSNPKGQEATGTSERLIRYLIKHKHWSPFEMGHMTVEIETTKDIAIQVLRHRSFSFQEFSQRYADVSLLPILELPELRYQDHKNRQASIQDEDGDLRLLFESQMRDLFLRSRNLYGAMLEAGVAKECARKVLPIGTTTRLYMSGSIRSWVHYLQVRTGPETQKEHRDLAQAIALELAAHCPNIYDAIFATEVPCPRKPSTPSPNEKTTLSRFVSWIRRTYVGG